MADDKELAAKITEANKQKSLAEAREADAKAEKQIIETRKAARDFERDNGKIPEISALNGKITATDNFIETKILANCCLSYLIEELIETMNCDDKFKKNIEKAANNTKAAPTKFIFYNANDIPVLEQYMATSQQLSILTDCFKKILQLPKTELKTDTDSPSGGTGIIEMLKTEKAYIIKINATLNGSTNIKENLFSSAKISFSGGADLPASSFLTREPYISLIMQVNTLLIKPVRKCPSIN
ncbi:hypothetical protein QFZ20_002055 [Flavobacterium sp. W4I14]|nr:hypothetical protein [Flavobacterium sp. W4I14]